MPNASLPLRAPVTRRIAARIADHARMSELFRDLGHALGVRDLRVSGELGLVEGSIHDQALLTLYAQGHPWATFGLDYLNEFFCKSHYGTFIDGGSGIGLWTLSIAREEFVLCKAFEPDGPTFNYLASNVRRNCPNGNAEVAHASAMELDRHIAPGGLRMPLAVKLDVANIDQAVIGSAALLASTDIAVLNSWPNSEPALRKLEQSFPSAALITPDDFEVRWQRPRDLVPPGGEFEVLLRK
jgi:hypothetical protein